MNYFTLQSFTGSFRVLNDSSPQFLPIPSLAKAQVRRPAMQIPPPSISIFVSQSFIFSYIIEYKRRLTYPQRHPLNWKELAFQKALKGARSPASVCVTGPSNHSTYMPIYITLFLKQRTLHPGAG